MRTIICGSRSALDYENMCAAMQMAELFEGIVPTVILSGNARGADSLGEMWAKARGIPLELYPADWKTFGYGAGFARNHDMIKAGAQACVALRMPGISNGTDHMTRLSIAAGLIVSIYNVPSFAPTPAPKKWRGL